MNRWTDFFMDLAIRTAKQSKDPSGQVGAVIARGKTFISLGYNGFAAGVSDTQERLNNRELKYPLTLHAELNAVLSAREDLTGCTIYVTHPPCIQCTSVVIQSGIEKVIFKKPSEDFLSRWRDSVELSKVILREAEVDFIEIG